MGERFALIAGAGDLPLILARAAKAQDVSFIAVALTEAAIAPLEDLADKVYRISIGQIGKIIKTVKKEDIDNVLFIGKVKKDLLFEKIRFDLKALKLLATLKNRNDDTIMLAIVRELANEGIEVMDQTIYLRDLMPKASVLTKKKLKKNEWDDIHYGMEMAKKAAGLDIGQTVVVKDKAIMAVEAIEGTDEAIIRGGLLARNGAVVAKVAKPNQDPRFDVPVVGHTTLESMVKGGATVLAIEAGKTLMLDKENIVKEADAKGLRIVSYDFEEHS